MAYLSYTAVYSRVDTLMGTVATQSSLTFSHAPTDYGTDFRVTGGQAVYQVQCDPSDPFNESNERYPRINLSIAIHFYATSLATEKSFTLTAMPIAYEVFADPAAFRTADGVFEIDHDEGIEISEGVREGKVISFEITIPLVMTPFEET